MAIVPHARRRVKPARPFGEGLPAEEPEPAWEPELRRLMSRLGYTSAAVADAVEHARGRPTLAGCESVEPSDVELLDGVLTGCRTAVNLERPDVPAPRRFDPSPSDRSWAAGTAVVHFQGTVLRNLTCDAPEDFLATLAHESAQQQPDRPVYARPVRRPYRPVSDRDVRRGGGAVG